MSYLRAQWSPSRVMPVVHPGEPDVAAGRAAAATTAVAHGREVVESEEHEHVQRERVEEHERARDAAREAHARGRERDPLSGRQIRVPPGCLLSGQARRATREAASRVCGRRRSAARAHLLNAAKGDTVSSYRRL